MGLPVGNKKKQADRLIDAMHRDLDNVDGMSLGHGIVSVDDYEPEFCEVVLRAMAKGFDKRATAGALCVSMDTFEEWQHKHLDFKTAVDVGENLCAAFWQKQGIKNLVFQPTGKQINSKVYSMNMAARYGWGQPTEKESKRAVAVAFEIDKRPEDYDD